MHSTLDLAVGGERISMSTALLCRKGTIGVNSRDTSGLVAPASLSVFASDEPDESTLSLATVLMTGTRSSHKPQLNLGPRQSNSPEDVSQPRGLCQTSRK